MAIVSGPLDSALDQFPPESPGPAPATVHETTAPSDHRPRARDISPEELEPTSIEAEDDAEDDATTRPKGPHWSVSFLIVGIVVIAVPLGIAAVMLTVALVFGLIWLSYTGLLVSVLRTQEAVIGLDPAPRLMIAAVWLLLTATAAAVLIRGRSLFLGLSGTGGTASVGWALTAAVSSVLVAFALTSWVITWLLSLGLL